MNLQSNAAKTIAALVVLNAGLFVSHHVPATVRAQGPEIQAQAAATRGEACKARAEAHKAAIEARSQARVAVREIVRAQIQARRDAVRAARTSPSVSPVKARSSVTDYVKCILSSGARAMTGGI
jgi:hypothetical protein